MMKMKDVSKIVIAVAISIVFIAMAGVKTTTFAAEAKGTKLPADGGEPGRDYMTYVKAVHKRDGATIRKMAEVPPGTTDKDFKGQMEIAAAITPTEQRGAAVDKRQLDYLLN